MKVAHFGGDIPSFLGEIVSYASADEFPGRIFEEMVRYDRSS
jgi:hypothetical protein